MSSETLLIRNGPEASEARRRYFSKLRAEAFAGPVVSALVEAPVRKRIGEQLIAAQDLSKHRKEIHQKRNEGLKTALDKRREYADKTKADLKIAEKGYSRSAKRAIIREESQVLEKKIISEREASGKIKPEMERTGVVGRLGNILERRSNKREVKRARGDARAFVKLSIAKREESAHRNIRDYELAHQEAKARRFQATTALARSRLHLGGNRSNTISGLRDVRRADQSPDQALQERLKTLSDRRAKNESKLSRGRSYTSSTSQKSYIAAANNGMSTDAHNRREEYIFSQLPVQGPSLPNEQAPVFAAPEAGTADLSLPAPGVVEPPISTTAHVVSATSWAPPTIRTPAGASATP